MPFVDRDPSWNKTLIYMLLNTFETLFDKYSFDFIFVRFIFVFEIKMRIRYINDLDIKIKFIVIYYNFFPFDICPSK